jgi:hypothetical protein
MTYKELLQKIVSMPTECLDKEIMLMCFSQDQAIEPKTLSVEDVDFEDWSNPFIIVEMEEKD